MREERRKNYNPAMRYAALLAGPLAAVLGLARFSWSQFQFDPDQSVNVSQVLQTASEAAHTMKAVPGKPVKKHGHYADFNFSAFITKKEMTRALQTMVDTAYGIGFRTIGHPDDLFHGHFIFDGVSPKPRFILYHAQERANLYALYKPGSVFDYTDKTKRNWIQWLDTFKVEDASLYRYGYTKPAWCVSEEAYTIGYEMLDPAKLGFTPTVIGEYYQFNYYQTKCKGKENDPDSDVLSVTLPAGDVVCLEFSDAASKRYSSNFFKFAQKLGEDQKKGKHLSVCPDPSAPEKP